MTQSIDAPGAISRNSSNDRSGKGAKKNYTEVGWSNDKGSIRLGHIHKQADVTAGVILQTPDSEHSLFLDIDGPRKGWTTSVGPGNFNVECGSANEEAEDSLCLTAKNGNILINAVNGKIRLQGTDIELVAVGENGSKGNIRMDATETVSINSKKFLASASVFYRISSVGFAEISACGPLTIYGMMISGITAAVAVKDSKVGGQLFQRLSNVLTAVNVFRQSSARN